jgi:hypothetical protein
LFKASLTNNKLNGKTYAAILSERRYVSHGVAHAASVFVKAITAILGTVILPITIISKASTGKFLHQQLFSVRGEKFTNDPAAFPSK